MISSTMDSRPPSFRRTGLALDTSFTEHRTPAGHPERPERILSIKKSLEQSGLASACLPLATKEVDLAWVETNHAPQYLARLRSACSSGATHIDCEDSAIVPASFEVARRATGTLLHAIDGVMQKEIDNAFCAVRPPGHHAEWDRSMGFCLFNNVAIGARYLLERYALDRVLILDWDVHHGNGTQHSFEADPRVFFCSIHGAPETLYPGTGFAHETGRDAGKGFTLNIPMPPHSTDQDYRQALSEKFLPQADKFQPQFVLLSAGFDAHREDPIGDSEA